MEDAHVYLTVRNGGSQAINKVTPSWSTEPGLDISSDTSTVDQIPTGGSVVWDFHITRNSDALSANPVPIKVDYRIGGPYGLAAVSTTNLTVQDRAAKAATDLVELRLQGSLANLESGRAGILYVVVTNKSTIPIWLSSLRVAVPQFLTVCVADFGCGNAETTQKIGESQVVAVGIGKRIDPHQVQLLTISLSANPAVEPGAHSVVVTASITWREGGMAQNGTAASTLELTSAVLGEKDILSVIGIPSLFLIPGFVVTVTFGLFWKYLSPKADIQLLQPMTPGFWMVPITLSLIGVPLAYPAFPAGRAILAGTYSQSYIAQVWAVALAIGILAYLVARLGLAGWTSYFVPAANDSQLKIIEKLARNGKSLMLPIVDVGPDGQAETVYRLYDDNSRNVVWVSPSVTYPRDTQLPEALAQALSANDASNSAKLLKTSGIHLNWGPHGATVSMPTEVAEVKPTPDKRRIVERETPPAGGG